MPHTNAEEATNAFLSTMAVLRYRSICAAREGSTMRLRTRMEFARKLSFVLFMSLMRQDMHLTQHLKYLLDGRHTGAMCAWDGRPSQCQKHQDLRCVHLARGSSLFGCPISDATQRVLGP